MSEFSGQINSILPSKDSLLPVKSQKVQKVPEVAKLEAHGARRVKGHLVNPKCDIRLSPKPPLTMTTMIKWLRVQTCSVLLTPEKAEVIVLRPLLSVVMCKRIHLSR